MSRTRYANRYRPLPEAFDGLRKRPGTFGATFGSATSSGVASLGAEPTFHHTLGTPDSGNTSPRLGRVMIEIDPIVLGELRATRNELFARVDTLSAQLDGTTRLAIFGMTAVAGLGLVLYLRN